MKNNKRITSNTTIPKGYRLKPSTHRLIRQVQRSFNTTQDSVISRAIRLFRKEIGLKTKINK